MDYKIITESKGIKDHVLSVRTRKELVKEAKQLGINIAKTLHEALEQIVTQAKKTKNRA